MAVITHFIVFCQYLVTLFKTNPTVDINYYTDKKNYGYYDKIESYTQKAKTLYVILSQKPMNAYMNIHKLSIDGKCTELPNEYICCEYSPCMHTFDRFWNLYLKAIDPNSSNSIKPDKYPFPLMFLSNTTGKEIDEDVLCIPLSTKEQFDEWEMQVRKYTANKFNLLDNFIILLFMIKKFPKKITYKYSGSTFSTHVHMCLNGEMQNKVYEFMISKALDDRQAAKFSYALLH